MSIISLDPIYFLPDRGDSIKGEIGTTITSFNFDLYAREYIPPFASLSFTYQLVQIKKDLESYFWKTNSKLIAHGYGAYLLLQALAELEPFPGHILLFSPILGVTIEDHPLFMSRPPRAKHLLQLAEKGQFPKPNSLEIHTEKNEDDGCPPHLAQKIAALIDNTEIHFVENSRGNFSSQYLHNTLSSFLTTR
ncbi:MAG: hypothetical protein QM479_07865 [Pseudomonadota bacterium]